MIRMASGDDLLSEQAPMSDRSLRVAIVVHSIADLARFTVQNTVGVTYQSELGRTSAVLDGFRMHHQIVTLAAQKTYYAKCIALDIRLPVHRC